MKDQTKKTNLYLESFKRDLIHLKMHRFDIESDEVYQTLNQYMDMETDAFDSDDLNRILDEVFE